MLDTGPTHLQPLQALDTPPALVLAQKSGVRELKLKLRELTLVFKWTRPYDFQVVLDRESTDDKFGMAYKQTNGTWLSQVSGHEVM